MNKSFDIEKVEKAERIISTIIGLLIVIGVFFLGRHSASINFDKFKGDRYNQSYNMGFENNYYKNK